MCKHQTKYCFFNLKITVTLNSLPVGCLALLGCEINGQLSEVILPCVFCISYHSVTIKIFLPLAYISDGIKIPPLIKRINQIYDLILGKTRVIGLANFGALQTQKFISLHRIIL